jgi:hypothetical protein
MLPQLIQNQGHFCVNTDRLIGFEPPVFLPGLIKGLGIAVGVVEHLAREGLAAVERGFTHGAGGRAAGGDGAILPSSALGVAREWASELTVGALGAVGNKPWPCLREL